MKNNQNIVIIGGAGYIGSVVTDFFLKKNYFVKSVDNLTYRQKVPFYKKNFYFYNLDISKKEKIEKIIDANSIVILLAGLVGDPKTKKYPQK